MEKSENEETPANDDLKLSEEDEPTDEKSKTTAAKKGPTKRSAPASGKKTAAVPSAKKKGQTDEPFEDRTNEEKNEVADNNSDDGTAHRSVIWSRDFSFALFLEASAAKQPKKGRAAAEKAPASATKTNNRTGKKSKAT